MITQEQCNVFFGALDRALEEAGLEGVMDWGALVVRSGDGTFTATFGGPHSAEEAATFFSKASHEFSRAAKNRLMEAPVRGNA